MDCNNEMFVPGYDIIKEYFKTRVAIYAKSLELVYNRILSNLGISEDELDSETGEFNGCGLGPNGICNSIDGIHSNAIDLDSDGAIIVGDRNLGIMFSASAVPESERDHYDIPAGSPEIVVYGASDEDYDSIIEACSGTPFRVVDYR